MKRLARWTMRLYPARWRRRYGDELDALIEQTGADARIIANLFAGGIRMQFSEWSFAKLAAVMGMAGLVIGVAASYMVAPMYRSSAELQVSSTDAASERELRGIGAQPKRVIVGDQRSAIEPLHGRSES